MGGLDEEETDSDVDGEVAEGGVDMARRSSAWSRGMKPGSIAVPPITRIEEARVFRRSIGTFHSKAM